MIFFNSINNLKKSNLQNNQRKDDLTIINQINKRTMFGISNVHNFKIEINIEFFDRLYPLIDIVPVNEDPLELTTHSAYFIKVKNLVDNMELRLDKFYNLTS
jgi:hypothetical protein